ncbi:MAG TPA: hypothetical protein PKI10_14700 [Syntrophorhabdus sp.]|jgi:hypothetical protein|nr:hypothetical protein [Syntrophorhabdus sp.]
MKAKGKQTYTVSINWPQVDPSQHLSDIVWTIGDFSTFDITKAFPSITKERLRNWLNAKAVTPTKEAGGQGGRASFTYMDVLAIHLYEQLLDHGLTGSLSSQIVAAFRKQRTSVAGQLLAISEKIITRDSIEVIADVIDLRKDSPALSFPDDVEVTIILNLEVLIIRVLSALDRVIREKKR